MEKPSWYYNFYRTLILIYLWQFGKPLLTFLMLFNKGNDSYTIYLKDTRDNIQKLINLFKYVLGFTYKSGKMTIYGAKIDQSTKRG